MYYTLCEALVYFRDSKGRAHIEKTIHPNTAQESDSPTAYRPLTVKSLTPNLPNTTFISIRFDSTFHRYQPIYG